MPELRKDPILGRWVIISTERGKRPNDFAGQPAKRRQGFCPFCPGNEDKTPPEVLAFRENGSLPNSVGWKVRVVPNKFPALQIEGTLNRRGEGLYDKMNGIGAHEVFIETTDHDQDMAEMSVDHIESVLYAYRERMLDLKKDGRFRYILLFKNHGEEAGASLEHSHTQLIATPIVPKRVMEELDGSRKYFELKERCIFCDMVDQELQQGTRLVSENASFVSFEFFASRFPFETWVLPREHRTAFENMPVESLRPLAEVLKDTLLRLKTALNAPPYNFLFHTGPLHEPHLDHFHWHIEILPKLTKVAGFEWGSGFYINPTPPEDAAAYLRQMEIHASQETR
jgi:UDPglucose--hexose-1-phosphate uridylyltransferase